jgi:hypothetical protein
MDALLSIHVELIPCQLCMVLLQSYVTFLEIADSMVVMCTIVPLAISV